MKYNIGDKVRIKSLDWYNENKNHCGEIPLFKPSGLFVPDMSRYCNNIMTIKDICYGTCYRMKEDFWHYNWTDEMIEGLVEKTKVGTALNPIEFKPNANCITRERVDEMSLDKAGQITDFEYEGLAYTLPEGYQFVDENGNVINAQKIVLEKKKKEYPKTYEECCRILQYIEELKVYPPFNADVPEYDVLGLFNSLEALRKLRICRDAYWKIAGEEMGLGEPWEPDWTIESSKYIILFKETKIEKHVTCKYSRVLAFPTAEMRDAFYDNFKELIESVKELL